MKKMSKVNVLLIGVVVLSIVVLPAAPGFGWRVFVAKTGQTAQYEPGDDGDLQKGVRWPKPRFIDLGNGWVLDRLTWLQWLKNANCAGEVTWQGALNFVDDLNDDLVDCDQTNLHWKPARLPNVRELQSLIHYGYFDPAVPNAAGTGKWTEDDPFTNVQSDVQVNQFGYYWSSTTSAFDTPTYAFYVGMGYGYGSVLNKTLKAYVWPVRGGNW